MLQSEQIYIDRLPRVGGSAFMNGFGAGARQRFVLLYDGVLHSKYKIFINQFHKKIKLPSGERLKSLNQFHRVVNQVAHMSEGHAPIFVAFGGGSVSDFVGFLSSVYRRGSPLIHIPSTWLAALDSAHGGKNGLNLAGAKNQIGTYWAAKKVLMVREVLLNLPIERTQELRGEIVKTSLLRGDSVWKSPRLQEPQFLWEYLPRAVRFKYQVVKKDPFEKKGLRQTLNFGHTVGHVLEARDCIPHGEAVRLGLCFDLSWSARLGILNKAQLATMKQQSWWEPQEKLAELLRGIRQSRSLFLRDKKRDANQIAYTFLEEPGRPLVRLMSVDQIMKEVHRQCRV